MNTQRKAFTLIELLVVVSIIALLVSILLPALGRARDQAKRVMCMSNLKQITTVTWQYAPDYDGWTPSSCYWWQEGGDWHTSPWASTLSRANYVEGGLNPLQRLSSKAAEICRCPSWSYPKENQYYAHPYYTYAMRMEGYGWDPESNYGHIRLDATEYPSTYALFWDSAKGHPYQDEYLYQYYGCPINTTAGWLSSDTWIRVHLRHVQTAGVAFADSSVRACNEGALNAAGFDEKAMLLMREILLN